MVVSTTSHPTLPKYASNSLTFDPVPQTPFTYAIPDTLLMLIVTSTKRPLEPVTDALICFLDATRYNIMMIVTEGSTVRMEPHITHSSGDVELILETASSLMTLEYLAWLIEGWLDLIVRYGYWETTLQLGDRKTGLLALATIQISRQESR